MPSQAARGCESMLVTIMIRGTLVAPNTPPARVSAGWTRSLHWDRPVHVSTRVHSTDRKTVEGGYGSVRSSFIIMLGERFVPEQTADLGRAPPLAI